MVRKMRVAAPCAVSSTEAAEVLMQAGARCRLCSSPLRGARGAACARAHAQMCVCAPDVCVSSRCVFIIQMCVSSRCVCVIQTCVIQTHHPDVSVSSRCVSSRDVTVMFVWSRCAFCPDVWHPGVHTPDVCVCHPDVMYNPDVHV